MTSLSTRSSNAIRLSPGRGRSVLIDSGRGEKQAHLSGETVAQYFRFNKPWLNKSYLYFTSMVRCPEAVLIYLSSLCVLFALLSFRVLDDNRLTSWQWIFSESDLLIISFSLVIALLLAWLLSAIELARYFAVAILFVLSYFIGILQWDNPEVIVDAARYFTQAKYIELYGIGYFFSEWGREIMAWTDLPLVPFIYGTLFKVFGESRAVIQGVNTLFFSGSVVITYFIGRDLWDERVGLYGAVMLLAIPYLHTQVPLMLVDVPAMFFLSLAVFSYILALTRKGLMLPVLAAACVVLAMLAKYSNWLMLSVLPIISLVLILAATNSDSRQRILRKNISVLIGLSIITVPLLFLKYEVFSQQMGLLMNYQLPALGGWSESHLSTFLFQVHPFVSIAALVSTYIAYKKRDLIYLIISWMLLLVLVVDIRRARYVLIMFPMLALMAGYALAHIETARIRRYLTLCILLSASLFSVTGFSSFLVSASASNIQHASEYVDSMDIAAVEIIAMPQARSAINPIMSIPLFDLHSQKQIIYSANEVGDTDTQLKRHNRSSLRFTWEYSLPSYYLLKNENTERIIVVISDSEDKGLPVEVKDRLSGYSLIRRFGNDEGIFRYKTIVDVYVPVHVVNKYMTL